MKNNKFGKSTYFNSFHPGKTTIMDAFECLKRNIGVFKFVKNSRDLTVRITDLSGDTVAYFDKRYSLSWDYRKIKELFDCYVYACSDFQKQIKVKSIKINELNCLVDIEIYGFEKDWFAKTQDEQQKVLEKMDGYERKATSK